MRYIVIKLTNGEWVKMAARDIVALCLAHSNAEDELFIERQLYSGTTDNTVMNEQQMWRDIQEDER